MIKKIVFDFDGVLVNSGPFHLKYLNEWGGPKVSEELFYNKHKGNTNDTSNLTNFDRVDWVAYKKYIYDIEIQQKLEVMCKNFVKEKCSELSCSIITSGQEKNVSGFLMNHQINQYYKYVWGKETHPKKINKFLMLFEKENLRKEEVVFITDTLGDILEAHEVGVRTIAVDFGYHKRETLEEGKPLAICSSWDEVGKVIDSL